MKTIYRKVKCSDRLPKYNQFVHIIHDGGLIGFGFYSQNEKDWFDDKSAYLNHVEYWLERQEGVFLLEWFIRRLSNGAKRFIITTK